MTKAAKKRAISAMLDKWPSQATITGDDDVWLRNLITSHPDYPQKFGDVVRFFVAATPYGGRCFWFENTAGIIDNFSSGSCVDGNPPLRRRLVIACRAAAQPDVHAFKAAYFNGARHAKCSATGETIHWDDAHVDHIVPFIELATYWIDTSPDLSLADLSPDAPGAAGDTFLNPSVADSFRRFHAAEATLRVVKASVNLSRGARRDI
jgi:hypothetical protein